MTGDTMTVTGKTLGENVDKWQVKHKKDWEGQDIIRPVSNPIKKTGHIRQVNLTLWDSSIAYRSWCRQNPQGKPRTGRRRRQDHRQGGSDLFGQMPSIRRRGLVCPCH